MQRVPPSLYETSIRWVKSFLFTLLCVVSFLACHQVTVKIESLPENTPANANIYVAGNFNNWYAGDRNFLLERDSAGGYFIDLPKGSGLLKFRFNRGDANTVEADECGSVIPEREIQYDRDDTIAVRVASWKDLDPLNCQSITFIVKSLPQNTPFGDSITLVGTFNNWDATEGDYTLREQGDGTYGITLHKIVPRDFHEFKFSRGSMFSLEGDRFGSSLPNRVFRFGERDTIFIDIATWEDLYGTDEQLRTVILTKIPSTTPKDAELYLAGNFNGWYPRDKKYRFIENKKGQLMLQFPKKEYDLKFKITRGDWSTQEVDKEGVKFKNRKWAIDEPDTLFIQIENWFDRMASSKDRVTLVVNNVPDNTPENDKIYLAGNFNRWKTGDPRYQFEKLEDGGYIFHFRRSNSDLHFKLNRGQKSSIEVDQHGNHIVGRLFRFGSADTVKIQVDNWLDLAEWQYSEVTIVLLKVPPATPAHSDIYIVGNFNGRNYKDPEYKLKRNRKGEYFITLPRKRNGNPLRFWFSRGSKKTVEVDEFGKDQKRTYNFAYNDKVYIEIHGWKDLQ